MNRVGIAFFISILFTLSGCITITKSDEVNNMKNELERLYSKIEILTEENQNLLLHVKTSKQKEGETLSLNYIELNEKSRFIPTMNELLLTPENGARVLRNIDKKTVVEVIDVVEVFGEVWLYVKVPVFDSPTNMKGWIKEESTELYTVEKMNQVLSPVKVAVGTDVYHVDLETVLSTVNPLKIEIEQHCFISDSKDDYLALGCAGGTSFIVKRSDVIYPPIE